MAKKTKLPEDEILDGNEVVAEEDVAAPVKEGKAKHGTLIELFHPTGQFEVATVVGGYRVMGPKGQYISGVFEDRAIAQDQAINQNMHLRRNNSFEGRV